MPIFIPAAESHPLTGQRCRSSCATSSSAPVTGVSDDVHDVHEADRVTIAPIYRCGDCRPCTTGHDELCKKVGFHGLMTDGGMAEYTVVPRNQVHHLPDSITLEIRALVEPVAVAYRSVKRADVHDQSSALIYGAGSIGIGLWFALRAFGLTEVEVVEPSEHLRRSIEALGARTIHPTSVDIAVVIAYRTDETALMPRSTLPA